MIELLLDQKSVADVVGELRDVQTRVLGAINGGMREGISILAHSVSSSVTHRSGKFAISILNSQRVSQSEDFIKGFISTFVGGKPMGNWFENGVNIPEVTGKLMVFTAKDGVLVFTRFHRAFHVPGRPNISIAAHQAQPRIIDAIMSRVREASK